MSSVKKLIILLLTTAICVGGLFIYEVKKEHHYAPQTDEIILNNPDILADAFIMKGDTPVEINLSDIITFVSDVENGTANLETTKKVFGFYECEINRVYDEYTPVIVYTSEDGNIATVDENGVITAVSKGKTTIIVSADNKVLKIPISVYKGVEVSQLEQNTVLLKGESKDFMNLGEYEVALSPFYSSDESVAVVNGNGKVTAVSKGKAEIYTYNDKSDKISTAVTVKQPVESATINDVTLYIGETAKVKVSYKPQNADYGTDFTYKSGNAAVATVSGNVVAAVKAGETTITATSSNGVSAQAKVMVKNPPQAKPTITTITRDEFDAYKGEKYTDNSPYRSCFTITFDQPVIGFKINYVNDEITSISTGDAIYKNASVDANTTLYFAVCINTSDVFIQEVSHTQTETAA